jgi:hypothetical protein
MKPSHLLSGLQRGARAGISVINGFGSALPPPGTIQMDELRLFFSASMVVTT